MLIGWGICFSRLKADIQEDEYPARIVAESHKGAPIILMGDSVIDSIAKGDTDRRTIAQFLEDILGVEVQNASLHGLRLQTAIPVLSLIHSQSSRKRQIVVQQLDPAFQQTTVNSLFNLWKVRMQLFEKKSPSFLDVMRYGLYKELSEKGPEASSERSKLLAQMKAVQGLDLKLAWDSMDTYRLELSDVENELSALQAMVRTVADQLICFINPVDKVMLENVLGSTYVQALDERAAVFKEACKRLGIPIIDLQDAIPESYHFNDGNRIHLDDYGRSLVAEHLARYIVASGAFKSQS